MTRKPYDPADWTPAALAESARRAKEIFDQKLPELMARREANIAAAVAAKRGVAA